MVTYQQLLDAEASRFHDAADACSAFASSIDGEADRISKHARDLRDAWQDSQHGCPAAAASLDETATSVASLAEDFRAVCVALQNLAAAVDHNKKRVEEAVVEATVRLIPGSVSSSGWVEIPLDPQLAATLNQRIDDAIKAVNEADKDAAATLMSVWPEHLPPVTNMPPQAVETWWNGLSQKERTMYMTSHPTLIGGMDGLPVDVRDTVNRRILAAEIAALEEQKGDDFSDEDAERLAALKAIRDAGTDTHPAHILLIDTAANDGEGAAIVSFGDPTTAKNVMTFVPGMDTYLNDVDDEHSTLDRTQLLASKSGEDTAVIAYLNYESPSLTEAPSPNNAIDGAKELSQFQEGLRVTDEGATSTNTVTGYSYGSTLVGFTGTEHGLHADKVILVGSPGVYAETAADLGIDGNGDGKSDALNVYTTETPGDTIAHSGWHENRPFSVDGTGPFGANPFSSLPTEYNLLKDHVIGDHTHYFEKHQFQDPQGAGSNIVDIITQEDPTVTPPDPEKYD